MHHYAVKFFYPNGYGASVVSHRLSYGGPEGKFEVAVINHDEEIVYNTPICPDVIGWVDFAGVADILEEIKNLPAMENANVCKA